MSKNRKKRVPEELPDHESGVRRLFSDAHNLPYRPLRSFDEAKRFSDAVAVLEGDWGGQIYVVCPISMIACDEATLHIVLHDLDAIAWACNEGEGARVYYERAAVGSGIAGGMGGAMVTAGIWVHEEFESKNLGDAIRSVLLGQRQRLAK